MPLKKSLLILSFITISVIALLYGVSPDWFYGAFLVDSKPPGIDGLFWLWSAFSDKYRDAGVLVLCIFCGGLVAGRILSVVVDGVPSPILLLYIAMELGMVPICIWLLRRGH
jgi:hypothetical protein